MASQTLNDGHAPRSRFSRALPIAVLIAIVAVLAPVISHYYVIFYLQSFSYGESSAIPYALEKLGSENAWIRAAAAHGLSMIGPKARQAVPQLLEALRNDNRDVASSAAVALGSIDGTSPEVIAALVAGLDHDDWQVRSYCANAIDEIGPRAWTAIPKLRELVSDPRMGWVAVRTLGELNARVAIPEITAFLANSEDGHKLRESTHSANYNHYRKAQSKSSNACGTTKMKSYAMRQDACWASNLPSI